MRAQSRLDDILDGETRNAIASHELLEIIRSENREARVDEALAEAGESVGQLEQIEVGREAICRMIADNARGRLEGLGIELLDIRFKRINYSEDVRQKIFERMVSERRQIAEKFRSEGQGEAARIDGQREYMLKKINSEAYREVQQIKGQADARATEIYASAYNQSEEALDFYEFIKTMETYEQTLGMDTRLLMSTDNDLLKYLRGPLTR
jgi:membrane protease subunit HflC